MSTSLVNAAFCGAATLGAAFLYVRAVLRAQRSASPSPTAPAPGALLFSAVQAPYLAASAAPAVTHYTVAHLSASFPKAESFPSPLCTREWPRNLNFVALHEEVVESQILRQAAVSSSGGAPATAREDVRAFVRAGPVERLYWEPSTARAAIVTCGGLCPGLNTVVREIVMCLHYVYGTREVFGVPNGYAGFYGSAPWQLLTPASVSSIHTLGGTVLGSSRGGFDEDRILGALEAKGINMLFVIGGDGTHRGALQLIRGAAARGLQISVCGVPKTVDNDIPMCVRVWCAASPPSPLLPHARAFVSPPPPARLAPPPTHPPHPPNPHSTPYSLDKTFGFDTAVEEAVRPICCANVEAKAAQGGIGLVKLMGREAGFISLHASMASRDVNLVLIPEAPWRLRNVLAWLEKRLEQRGHAVIVVAEGAESLEQKEAKAAAAAAAAAAGGGAGGGAAVAKDASGNRVLDDVGLYLKEAINRHFKAAGKPASLKYIDPSYIIRSSPPCASDSNLCTNLAYNAVHGAMAGYTGVTVGVVENHYVFLPIAVLSTMPSRVVDIGGRAYARLCASTGQPKLDD
jgi:6-phosphofructokinase 1